MSDFNKLEDEITGDWLDIQKRIQEKELREKEINNPKRLCCTFQEFYKLIYQAVYNPTDQYKKLALHEMLRMVLSSREKMPKGFENIWDVFCNTYSNIINTLECINCGEKYELLYKRLRPVVTYEFGAGVDDVITIRYESIFCPKCGKIIGRLEQGTFISLTTYNNIHDNMEERSNDIKYEF